MASCLFEAAPCVHIRFIIEKEYGSHIMHEAECLTSVLIGGLKEDLSNAIGIKPEDQRWYFGEHLLENGKTLIDYGIFDSTGKKHINVKSSKYI